MDKRESKRINPIANLALAAILILLAFQALVIGGALELESSTVAKYTPWAYEAFLRLVGDHPDSAPRWASVEETETPSADESDAITMTGLDPSSIPVLIESNEAVHSTNTVPAAAAPVIEERDDAPGTPPPDEKIDVPVG